MTMAFVVTDNCVLCKHTDCVEICPVEWFHEGPDFLVIDPEECIDCGLCKAECPIDAIYAEDELPPEQAQYIALNAELAQKWPLIAIQKSPLSEHEKWQGVPNKLQYLQR